MAATIDTCGLSCPQPVLMFLTELKNSPDAEFDVLVDNETSRENVSRAARNHGFIVSPVDEEDGVTRLEIRKE